MRDRTLEIVFIVAALLLLIVIIWAIYCMNEALKSDVSKTIVWKYADNTRQAFLVSARDSIAQVTAQQGCACRTQSRM